MKNGKQLLAGAALVLAFGFGSAQAGIDLNEVGAFLVFPGVVAGATGPGALTPNIETFMTITNTVSTAIVAHATFIDQDTCGECDWNIPMTGFDTETIVVIRDTTNNVTHFTNIDTGAVHTCRDALGFVTINVEDGSGNVLTDNVLNGEEVVVDYGNGAALSVEAISIQGEIGDGDHNFAFDGAEYRKFPSALGADFIAPDFAATPPGGPVYAALVLFTLAFERRFPPVTDCDVLGYDAFENSFSGGFQFGCWTVESLQDIAPEFAYPYLGQATDNNDHGWLSLSCTVFGTGLNGVVDGGVHGAIAQFADTGAVLRRSGPAPGPAMVNADSWARLLYQSGTVGDAATLTLF